MSLLSRLRDALTGKTTPSTETPPPEAMARHDRREAGRERHHRTGEPAWKESDRLDDPPGTGKRDPDAAPEILGGS